MVSLVILTRALVTSHRPSLPQLPALQRIACTASNIYLTIRIAYGRSKPPTSGSRAADAAPRAEPMRGNARGSAGRWQEALEAGCAPRVYLEGCHESVLACGIALDDLKAHAVPPSSPA